MAMTIQGFISKMSGRISAEAFLKEHREYMLNGELSCVLTDLVEKIDNNQVSPKTGLVEIQQAAFSYFMEQKAKSAVKSITKSTKPSNKKMYSAAIYTEDGGIATYLDNDGNEKELIFNTDNPLQGEGWCHRKLFDLPNCYGRMVNTKTGYTVEISRDSAIAAILKTGPIGAYKKVGSSGTLTGKMKAKGDHFHFSRG